MSSPKTGSPLRHPTGSELVAGTRVSDGFFRTLGVAPMLGRDFYAGEDLPAAVPVVMLSYATWQKRFGGRQDVIGQTVTLSDARTPSSACCRRISIRSPRAGGVLDHAARFRLLRKTGEVATTLTE